MRFVYLAGPITGVPADLAQNWRRNPRFHDALRAINWEPLSPFDWPDGRTPTVIEGNDPIPTWFEDELDGVGAALMAVERDITYIQKAGALIVELRCAEHASIGTMCEMGYAYALGKPIITVLERHEIHDHPFVVGMSYRIVNQLDAAVDELKLLGQKLREPSYA